MLLAKFILALAVAFQSGERGCGYFHVSWLLRFRTF